MVRTAIGMIVFRTVAECLAVIIAGLQRWIALVYILRMVLDAAHRLKCAMCRTMYGVYAQKDGICQKRRI